jgi:hypothetical protein
VVIHHHDIMIKTTRNKHCKKIHAQPSSFVKDIFQIQLSMIVWNCNFVCSFEVPILLQQRELDDHFVSSHTVVTPVSQTIIQTLMTYYNPSQNSFVVGENEKKQSIHSHSKITVAIWSNQFEVLSRFWLTFCWSATMYIYNYELDTNATLQCRPRSTTASLPVSSHSINYKKYSQSCDFYIASYSQF